MKNIFILAMCLSLFALASCVTGAVYPANPSESGGITEGATGIDPAKSVTTTFASPIIPSTITTSTFYLSQPASASASISKADATTLTCGDPVAGTSTGTSTTATFASNYSLPEYASCALYMTNGIYYETGIYADPITTSFTTGASFSGIVNDQTGISISDPITLTFTAALTQATVTTDTMYLTLPASSSTAATTEFDPTICDVANKIMATISCSSDTVCSITPATELFFGTKYGLCLTSGITYTSGMIYRGSTRLFTTATTEATITAPTAAEIRTALGLNNAYGMAVGLTLGAITLPVCTSSDTSLDITYSMTGVPSWLTLSTTSRALTLTSGTTFPSDAYTASSVTYTCYLTATPTTTASVTLTINDLDGGGVVDAYEYKYGAVPLLNNDGWFWLDPGNVNEYRTGTATFKRPTSLIKPIVGMDPTNAADDNEDFDGDVAILGGGTNLQEIANGTNMFIAKTAGTFANAVNYSVGNEPGGATIGDFDGDGNLDLALSNYMDDNISILIGNGDGTFDAAVDYGAGNGPSGFAVGDFNGDSNLDLATPNDIGGNVSVLIGNGDGTFDEAVNYNVGTGPGSISTADFNADGYLDLAVVNSGDDNVSVLIGNGDGTFGAAVNYGVGEEPGGVTTADFNVDGKLDLAVPNGVDDNVSILIGNGDGTFDPAVNYNAGSDYPQLLGSGDFNADGYIDLAVGEEGGTDVSILIGNGDGTFEAPVDYAAGTAVSCVAVADFNADNKPDVATSNFDDNNISILFGSGDGTFGAATNYNVGTEPSCIVIGDFTGNGELDIAVTNEWDDTVSILLSN